MTPEETDSLVRYRLEQARAALAEAATLHDAGHSGRSVVNRAYYAMFYAALALLHDRGLSPPRHSATIALLDREFVKTGLIGVEHSKALHAAFHLRQEEDYRPFVAVGADEVQRILRDARAFVDAAETCLRRP